MIHLIKKGSLPWYGFPVVWLFKTTTKEALKNPTPKGR